MAAFEKRPFNPESRTGRAVKRAGRPKAPTPVATNLKGIPVKEGGKGLKQAVPIPVAPTAKVESALGSKFAGVRRKVPLRSA